MTNWLRDPPFGVSLIPDDPDRADEFHRTVAKEILTEPDAVTLALYQAHSELHVVYFLLFNHGDKYQYRGNPPRYVKHLRFDEVQQIADRLKMPHDVAHDCYSIVIGGGHFVETSPATHKHFQDFVVELFGRKLYRTRKSNRTHPYLAKRRDSAIIWHESPEEVIEIWRTRVFLCKLGKLHKRFEKSPGEHFPFLEEIWHPKCSRTAVNIGGLEKLSPRYSLQEFSSIANKIKNRIKGELGRPRGGRHPTPYDFYKAVKRLFMELQVQNQSPPSQKEVARRMSLTLSTFKKYWRKTRRRWRDLAVECSEILGKRH